MNYSNQILRIVRKNKGVVTTSEVTAAKILPQHLKVLVAKGLLEHTTRGIYSLPSVLEDEMLNFQTRFKKGIFSHETALFIYNLTDRTPNKFTMTFPTGYNTSSIKKENLNYTHIKKEYLEIGAIWAKSPNWNPIRVYNAERTLCDLLKSQNNTDVQILVDALKEYTQSKNKNIPLLSEYAKKFRVEKKLRPYLEVLI